MHDTIQNKRMVKMLPFVITIEPMVNFSRTFMVGRSVGRSVGICFVVLKHGRTLRYGVVVGHCGMALCMISRCDMILK